MNRNLDNLDRRIVPHIHRRIRWQRHLWQTECPWVRILRWANDLEYGDHGEGHVGWSLVGSVGAESEVDVEERCGMALEPSGLDGDGSAGGGPHCAVGGCAHASAWGVLVDVYRRRGEGEGMDWSSESFSYCHPPDYW